jgi:hypothetical protein
MTGQAVDSMTPHSDRSAAALAAEGVRCALRYHYNLTRAEVDRLHRNGVGVCIIGEFDYYQGGRQVSPPLMTPEAGGAHGQRLVDVARSLGTPTGAVLILTADVMVYPERFETVGRYLRLAGEVIRGAGYRVGLYGGSLLIDWAHDHGLVDWTWEAAARSWSSPTGRSADYMPSQSAALRQLVAQPTFGGVQVDLNDYTGRPCPGEWLPDGTVSTGADTAQQEDDDMPTTWFLWEAHPDSTNRVPPGVYLAFSHDRFISALDGDEVAALQELAPLFPEGIKYQGKVDGRFWAGKILLPRHPGDIENLRASIIGAGPPVDVDALAAAIVAKLDGHSGDVTAEAVAAAVADVIHRIDVGLGSGPAWTPSD